MRHRPLVVCAALLAMALSAAGCTSGGSHAADSGSHTPTGKVTVKAHGKVVCVITLKNGTGSCKVGTSQYAPGTVRFSASYGSDGGSKSSSSEANLTVKKATTTTSLSLSATSVKYWAEQTERLSVQVAPHFAGTPAGKVTVRAGGTVVCVITLASAKGSCALTASQLASGSHPLVASYAGGASFTGSSSPQRMLTVTR
jgi:large repetitive protein